MKTSLYTKSILAAGLLAVSVASYASLTPFQTFTGNVGYSSDGFGSLASSGTISASVPAGSTILGAYLYQSGAIGNTTFGGTLNGTTVSYSPLGANTTAGSLQAARADVTSIVAPIINGGAGGVYNFTVTESSSGSQDGEALVVVYSNPALGIATFAILDGFSQSTGDSTSINFASPLNTSAPGFFAQMFIGDGFSAGGQSSTITVNGTVITTNAGNYDDGAGADGALITVGGFDDPFSTLLPSYANDHERYDLASYAGVIADGSSTIAITTRNQSLDDNIFLAGFYVSGVAAINQPPTTGVPEPETLALAGLGLTALAAVRRRRK